MHALKNKDMRLVLQKKGHLVLQGSPLRINEQFEKNGRGVLKKSEQEILNYSAGGNILISQWRSK